jgi:protein-disulfide isomerase
MATNRIRLVWHPLTTLDDRTTPPGYATRAANALACAADEGKLEQFEDILFTNQPASGSAGLTDDQLIDVAGPIGLIQPSFAACVRDVKYRDWLALGNSAAVERGVHAPAILVNGKPLAQPTAEAIMASVA